MILQISPKPTKRDISYPKDIQFVLSIIILDAVIVMSYSQIIYLRTFKNKKVSSNSKEKGKLPFACIALAAIFVLFTLPYAIGRFTFGKEPFWSNVILILNSGMNNIVYFFRAKASSYWQNKRRTNFSSNSNPKILTGSLPTLISGQSPSSDN